MSVTIVIDIQDEGLTDGEAHEAVVTALDLAGFRRWSSYIATRAADTPRRRDPGE